MLILSLPYHSPPSEHIPASIQYIEYRLDLGSTPIAYADFTDRHIITDKNIVDAADYLAIQEQTQAQRPLLDVELQLYEQIQYRLDPTRLIISLHQRDLDLQMIAKLLSHSSHAQYLKLSLYCNSWQEVVQIAEMSEGTPNLIFVVMGIYGKLQRILHTFLGSIGTYVYDQVSTAEGQLSLAELSRLRLQHFEPHTQVYGILGSEIVNRSLSFVAYNDYFATRHRPAIYLPLPAQTPTEARYLISWLNQKLDLVGLSITTPFKTLFSEYLTSTQKAINTLNFRTQTTANTDLLALRQALDSLAVNCAAEVLVYGSGATALAFISQLQHWGYQNLSIGARRLTEHSESISGIPCKAMQDMVYDLLINCTPLGCAEDDDISVVPRARKLLDLPYNNTQTLLAKKFGCESKAFVDGKTFWRWQFEFQRRILLSESKDI